MTIVFTAHAIRQLKERNLTQSEIARTVKNPEKVFAQSHSRYRAIRKISKSRKKYLLVVIYDTDENNIEIVTAFLTSKFDKYL